MQLQPVQIHLAEDKMVARRLALVLTPGPQVFLVAGTARCDSPMGTWLQRMHSVRAGCPTCYLIPTFALRFRRFRSLSRLIDFSYGIFKIFYRARIEDSRSESSSLEISTPFAGESQSDLDYSSIRPYHTCIPVLNRYRVCT